MALRSRLQQERQRLRAAKDKLKAAQLELEKLKNEFALKNGCEDVKITNYNLYNQYKILQAVVNQAAAMLSFHLYGGEEKHRDRVLAHVRYIIHRFIKR